MQDTASYLTDLGVPAEMTAASAAALTRIAAETGTGGAGLALTPHQAESMYRNQ